MTDTRPLADIIGDFVSGMTRNTANSYKRTLDSFVNWCDIPLEDVNRAKAQAWINHLRDQGLADTSVRQKRSALSSFYVYAMTEDALATNPFQLVRVPKGGNAQRAGISWPEAEQLLATAAAAGPNQHALVRILLTTGCRISAVCADANIPKHAAQISDLDKDGDTPVLQVRLKGGRTDRLPLAPNTHQVILEAIDGRTHGPILRSAVGTELNRDTGGRWIPKLSEKAGIRRITAHTLRHTCATVLAEKGVNPLRIQRLLGHQSIETTMRYVHLVENLAESPVHLLDTLGGQEGADPDHENYAEPTDQEKQ